MANYNISITANHTFAPQTQQVKSGDTVTWVDNDPDPNTSHTVTPDDPTAFQGSGDINAGDTFGPINFSGAPRTSAARLAAIPAGESPANRRVQLLL